MTSGEASQIERLVINNRSRRNFLQDENVSDLTLRWLIELARKTPSGANLQPLKYIISNRSSENEKIFSCLKWAGYLQDWQGPLETERPTAYIIILHDNDIRNEALIDLGIAAQTIMLAAVEKGFSGCIIGSIERENLRKLLNIDNRYKISLVLALGKSQEEVLIEDINSSESIKYYRDENNVHHVPKRSLDEVLISEFIQ